MDILVTLGVMAAVVGAVVVTVETFRAPLRDPKASRWFALAQACRLTEIRSTNRLSEDLSGRLGSLEVRLGPYAARKTRISTRLTVRGLSPLVFIKRESLGTRFGKTIGLGEIEVGDEAFDRALHVQGDEPVVRALLDVKMRKHLRTAFGGSAPAVDIELHFAAGEMTADFTDDVRSGRLPSRGKVRWLLGLAQRLQEPPHVPARLATTAEQEPLAAVRGRVLRVLERFVGTDARAKAALQRAAVADAVPEIRLQAALALERDGWPTLQELAMDESVDDSVSAHAIETLRGAMPSDQAAITMEKSLWNGRILTARAAARALGGAGETHVPALLAVLERVPDVAAAAAAALGQTGSASAEGPLIAALREDMPELRAAAVAALGHVGSAESMLALTGVAQESPALRTAALDAMVRIRSRLTGADPGQLSLAAGSDGQLALADGEPGRVTLPDPADPT